MSEQTREILIAIAVAAAFWSVGVAISAYIFSDGLHSVLAKPIQELP